jgi:hypothetical protein
VADWLTVSADDGPAHDDVPPHQALLHALLQEVAARPENSGEGAKAIRGVWSSRLRVSCKFSDLGASCSFLERWECCDLRKTSLQSAE